MENYLKYMAAFFGTIAVIIVIMLVYFTCWSISKRRREQQDGRAAIPHDHLWNVKKAARIRHPNAARWFQRMVSPR